MIACRDSRTPGETLSKGPCWFIGALETLPGDAGGVYTDYIWVVRLGVLGVPRNSFRVFVG